MPFRDVPVRRGRSLVPYEKVTEAEHLFAPSDTDCEPESSFLSCARRILSLLVTLAREPFPPAPRPHPGEVTPAHQSQRLFLGASVVPCVI